MRIPRWTKPQATILGTATYIDFCWRFSSCSAFHVSSTSHATSRQSSSAMRSPELLRHFNISSPPRLGTTLRSQKAPSLGHRGKKLCLLGCRYVQYLFLVLTVLKHLFFFSMLPQPPGSCVHTHHYLSAVQGILRGAPRTAWWMLSVPTLCRLILLYVVSNCNAVLVCYICALWIGIWILAIPVPVDTPWCL
jgi:hypothetical protein